MTDEITTVGRFVRIPQGSVRVEDADEEVFLLYTRLAANPVADGSKPFRGLGHVDSRKTNMTVRFELTAPVSSEDVGTSSSPTRRKGKKGSRKSGADEPIVVEVELIQDTTALRSRKGDTGSVLWKLSVQIAQMLLQQYHFGGDDALLNRTWLSNAHVLELGAGTGLLGIVLSPLVRQYTLTDIAVLIHLIRKNLTINSQASSANVTAEELDWVTLQSLSPAMRSKSFPCSAVDLLLVTDCVYHPSLLPPLVATINHLTTLEKTVVMIAVELRAEDVVREFLDLLITSCNSWQIWSVGEHLLDPAYALWIGWKTAT